MYTDIALILFDITLIVTRFISPSSGMVKYYTDAQIEGYLEKTLDPLDPPRPSTHDRRPST